MTQPSGPESPIQGNFWHSNVDGEILGVILSLRSGPAGVAILFGLCFSVLGTVLERVGGTV